MPRSKRDKGRSKMTKAELVHALERETARARS